jgi:Ca2+-binding RTX toxin-like protein
VIIVFNRRNSRFSLCLQAEIRIFAGGVDDTVLGGTGNDLIGGDAGNDTL